MAVLLAGPVATLTTTMALVAFAPGPWKFAGLVVAAPPDTTQQYRVGFAQFVNRSHQDRPCTLAVRDRATSEFLGHCELYDIGPAGISARLGWWLGAAARGRTAHPAQR